MMVSGYWEQTRRRRAVVFTAAQIPISAAEKLVPKAEIAMSAREIDVFAAQITVSRAEIIASLL